VKPGAVHARRTERRGARFGQEQGYWRPCNLKGCPVGDTAST
jgi:hypothetical protein